MLDRPFDSATALDGIRDTLSKIRAQRSEFHASIFKALDQMEQMGNKLSSHEESPMPQRVEVDQKIDHLSSMIAELADSLKSHQQVLADERTNWIKDIRCMQVQQLTQPPPKPNNRRNERGKR